jgi:S1-C subfamily serine protease
LDTNDVVYNDSPVFYANIVRGDVIIRINDHLISNKNDYNRMLNSFNKGDVLEVELIRNNRNQIIKFKI